MLPGKASFHPARERELPANSWGDLRTRAARGPLVGVEPAADSIQGSLFHSGPHTSTSLKLGTAEPRMRGRVEAVRESDGQILPRQRWNNRADGE